jgi:hypothetical protein
VTARSSTAHIEEIHPGDVFWFPPAEKNWHGATATTAMTPFRNSLTARQVVWLEKVSDEQYQASSDTALIWT